ncbi:efflux RND transporter permease subunit [Pleionea litopenaei]|uniref:Efflux RND transporter permease subunit n=1 Tax=Pleionea litopenaei TaxID=3070815 RepID=A0AA51RQD1_9GAMM|nr:efflux RND transporter permease subunit [Pleionea sp. HL-JVS1]WMS85534.1 efflux RND transporter permease subunit [Pleionea sp. HL-JVS1]
MTSNQTSHPRETGLIAWFVHNSVAANLLMIFLFIGGIASYFMMTKRMQPDIQPNMVQVSVAYLGAAPQEVENGVIIKIEEAIQDVKGIKRINSTAREGVGVVTATLYNDTDLDEALNEIKIQVDSIVTFPGETEKPLVSKVEFSADVLWLSIYGNMDRRTRQTIAQEVRDEVMTLSEVNKAEVMGNRPYEIAIEISDSQLRKYDLTMSEIAQAVRNYSLDLPGGTIKTHGGDIRLRTKGQAYTGLEFAQIVLRTNPDGTRLLLSDIANINDGFVESDGFARFNGEPATVIRVKSLGEQNDLEISKAVREYMKSKQESLPDGAKIEIWGDGSIYLQQRLDMMFWNMIMGVILVFVLLALFLRVKVALWVLVGIPICFCGAFLLMDKVGPLSTNINFLSLFGLILVLGIVVDDAIIIGESVYSEIKEHGHSKENVIRGAKKVAVPATFGVLTTIAAFLPLLTLDFMFAPFFEAIAVVVILCLIFSLIESKWILPAHLAHMRYDTYDEKKASGFAKVQHAVRQSMENFANNVYQPFLHGVVKHRYLTLVSFFSILIFSIALLATGWLKVEAFPKVSGDFVQANFSLNEGSPISQRDAMVERMEKAVQEANKVLIEEKNFGNPVLEHVLSWTNGEVGGGMFIELVKDESRLVTAPDFEKELRRQIGSVAGVKELRIMSDMGAGGDASISFRLVGSNYHNLEKASEALQKKLEEYDGVFDIRTSYSSGNKEIELELLPGAETLGISLANLGRQVRQAFYGEEAQRIQRGKDEIKVMVRYPLSERRSIANLESMRVRTSTGDWVPFSSVAKIKMGEGYSAIQREDRKRAISVMADFDPNKVQSGLVTEEINKEFIPELLAKYPGVNSELSGQSKEVGDMMKELGLSMLVALVLIYILIAIPLKSYSQPLMVMSVIPFGLIGAIAGHLIFGKSFSMMSAFGIIALSGVVVNDSLIMVEFVNRARKEGMSLREAILSAGVKRFRAIMLTSLTTFFGLFPIMFETSMQAQIIIPMAISLAFGIMFATVITLVLIPALYTILEDFKGAMRRLFVSQPYPQVKNDSPIQR